MKGSKVKVLPQSLHILEENQSNSFSFFAQLLVRTLVFTSSVNPRALEAWTQKTFKARTFKPKGGEEKYKSIFWPKTCLAFSFYGCLAAFLLSYCVLFLKFSALWKKEMINGQKVKWNQRIHTQKYCCCGRQKLMWNLPSVRLGVVHFTLPMQNSLWTSSKLEHENIFTSYSHCSFVRLRECGYSRGDWTKRPITLSEWLWQWLETREQSPAEAKTHFDSSRWSQSCRQSPARAVQEQRNSLQRRLLLFALSPLNPAVLALDLRTWDLGHFGGLARPLMQQAVEKTRATVPRRAPFIRNNMLFGVKTELAAAEARRVISGNRW